MIGQQTQHSEDRTAKKGQGRKDTQDRNEQSYCIIYIRPCERLICGNVTVRIELPEQNNEDSSQGRTATKGRPILN
jgi:hypothetical protein